MISAHFSGKKSPKVESSGHCLAAGSSQLDGNNRSKPSTSKQLGEPKRKRSSAQKKDPCEEQAQNAAASPTNKVCSISRSRRRPAAAAQVKYEQDTSESDAASGGRKVGEVARGRPPKRKKKVADDNADVGLFIYLLISLFIQLFAIRF